MATTMMKKMFKGKGVAGIDELLQSCIDVGVRLMPCQMTVEVFGYKQADFIPQAEQACGAAAFIRFASEADISLFI
jgi:peroxiredoxin family protein